MQLRRCALASVFIPRASSKSFEQTVSARGAGPSTESAGHSSATHRFALGSRIETGFEERRTAVISFVEGTATFANIRSADRAPMERLCTVCMPRTVCPASRGSGGRTRVLFQKAADHARITPELPSPGRVERRRWGRVRWHAKNAGRLQVFDLLVRVAVDTRCMRCAGLVRLALLKCFLRRCSTHPDFVAIVLQCKLTPVAYDKSLRPSRSAEPVQESERQQKCASTLPLAEMRR